MPNSLELNVSPALLHTFANHPFHVRKDMEMNELVDSIRESGVIVPLIVRTRPSSSRSIAFPRCCSQTRSSSRCPPMPTSFCPCSRLGSRHFASLPA